MVPGRPISWVKTLILASVIGCAAASADVIGTDERRAPHAEERVLVRALGHVFCMRHVDGVRRISAGTGTVVGSRSTILTAAHVFTDRAGRYGPAVRFDAINDCVFRQYNAAGDVQAEVGFRYASLGAFHENPGVPNQDWAVLRTTAPLPDSTAALPFANSVSDIDSLIGLSIRILAYHSDVRSARRTPLASEGELLSIDYGGYRRLAHTADMGRMSSGAALVHRTAGGQFVVVGINRSSAIHGEFNLAVPLSVELEAILRSHAWGQVPLLSQPLAMAIR